MEEKYMIKLVKNIQMLATLVATATYAAAFNPPGGVWQDIHDATGQHLPGDPIMRSTHHGRYVVFFYCNAVAFAFSLTVVVLTLLVTAQHKTSSSLINKKRVLLFLMSLMLVAMLTLAAAYGAGVCQDILTVGWYCLLVLVLLASFMKQITVRLRGSVGSGMTAADSGRSGMGGGVQVQTAVELMVPVSMFALTITYVAGLSTPGGFWDSAEGGHRPGDPILKDRLHGRTLKGFLVSNTLAFAASLYGVSFVVRKKRPSVAVGILARLNIFLVVFGLLGGLLMAYIIASSRGRISTSLLSEAALVCIGFYVAAYVSVLEAIQRCYSSKIEAIQSVVTSSRLWKAVTVVGKVSELIKIGSRKDGDSPADEKEMKRRRRQAKLVQLMAGLAVAITYQAGLYPPGGLWPSNTDGHTAGDPILLTTNYTRYRGFHYSNSLSFVASLLAMLLAQKKYLHEHHALEAAMLLDMLGLIGAYAIGSCRDQVSTLYVVGIAGAVVVYVFVHVSYFTLGDDGDDDHDEELLEKMRGRFLIFAILVASMTYQAGLTPPGGFLLKDDAQSGQHVGDPVIRYNYPRRYRAFFYCNSVSFMVSIVIILLLINPNEYKPAIRSHALSVCSVASYVCLMGAFAAGSTQHMKGSIYFIALAAAVTFCFCVAMPLCLWLRHKGGSNSNCNMHALLPTSCCIPNETNRGAPLGEEEKQDHIVENTAAPGGGGKEEEQQAGTTSHSEKEKDDKSVYLVTLAILVASATYPAGLDPPGGSWQSSSDGHDAGIPMMLDNRRPRYLAFFLSNTTSFMASLILIHMLLPLVVRLPLTNKPYEFYRKGVNGLVYLQCLGFLVAYAAGSSRRWKTSVYTGSALVILMLIFFSTHILLSLLRQKSKKNKQDKKNKQKKENKQTAQHCHCPCNHCSVQSA